MPQNVHQLHLNFDNWPLEPLTIRNLILEYSRVLDSRCREKSCILGNPEFADNLYHWFYDAQEELFFQVSLFRNQGQDFLRSSLAIELEADRKACIDNWKQDLATLMLMSDADIHWTKNVLPKKQWKHGLVLEISGLISEEDHPERLMGNLFTLLERLRMPLEIQCSLSLEWRQPRPLKKERMPDDIHHHFQARERWRRHMRHKVAMHSTPQRQIRRRIMVFSDQLPSSLLKQHIFRGLIGQVNVFAKWLNLSQQEIRNAHGGPQKAMSFTIPFNEQIPKWELRSMLTADLSKGAQNHLHAHPSHDDIPF